MLETAKTMKGLVRTEKFFIKYWKNKGGIKNNTVEVLIKTDYLNGKEYDEKFKMFIKDINENGGMVYLIDTVSILAYFNVITFNYYLKVIEKY